MGCVGVVWRPSAFWPPVPETSPSKSTNFWYLLLYPLTFLDHHVIFIFRLLLTSASSCAQVILPVGFMWQKPVNKHIASNVYPWPLPFKIDSLVYISSGTFTPETGSLKLLKMLGPPRRWTKQKMQTICRLLQKSTVCPHLGDCLQLLPPHLRRGHSRAGRGSEKDDEDIWKSIHTRMTKPSRTLQPRNETSGRTAK